MTMGFKVKDSEQLKNLKAGDEVEFDLKAVPSDKPDMPTQYMIDRLVKMPHKKNSEMKSNISGAKP